MRVSPPRMLVSSWLTSLMTCWLGSSAFDDSIPMAPSRIRATTLRTTLTLTSASKSAVRISLRTSSTSASVNRPLPRIRLKIPSKRLERLSNIAILRLPPRFQAVTASARRGSGDFVGNHRQSHAIGAVVHREGEIFPVTTTNSNRQTFGLGCFGGLGFGHTQN